MVNDTVSSTPESTDRKAVVGYAVSTGERWVLLIRKARPAWQRGRLNGLGGKVEPGETYVDAMVREFREESGIESNASDWTHIVQLTHNDWSIAFFKAKFEFSVLRRAYERSAGVTQLAFVPSEYEQLELVSTDNLRSLSALRNVKWMVPLCLDDSRYGYPIVISERSDEENLSR